jgi:hypothetical protein
MFKPQFQERTGGKEATKKGKLLIFYKNQIFVTILRTVSQKAWSPNMMYSI